MIKIVSLCAVLLIANAATPVTTQANSINYYGLGANRAPCPSGFHQGSGGSCIKNPSGGTSRGCTAQNRCARG
jgi:hypothetical protein